MARYPGFIGQSGTLASRNVNAERTVNLCLEAAPGSGKSDKWLRPSPGLSAFISLGAGPVRTVFYQDGRAFAVSGDRFYEWFADGTAIARGVVELDSRPAQIVSNGRLGNQLFIVTGMGGYIFNLATNAFSRISSPGFPDACLFGAFADGYFLGLYSGLPKFAFSNLTAGLTWDVLDVAAKSQTSDNIVAMVYDHKELWLLGSKYTEVWADTGSALTPWSPRPVLIEGGIGAQDSWAKGDGSIFWVQGNEQGARRIVRSRGYQAVDIGTQAVITAMNGYSRIDDAIGWFFELDNHGFYVLSFPTAQATWAYDVATGAWFEWLYWDTTTGAYQHHLARCHCQAFTGVNQRSFVGSRVDGTIYEVSFAHRTDNGHVVRRLRRAPHVIADGVEVFHSYLELLMQWAPGVSAGGSGFDASTFIRYSDDGGDTWSSELLLGAMPDAQRDRRAMWDQLGSSRNRVYEFVTTDPAFQGVIDAILEAEAGAF